MSTTTYSERGLGIYSDCWGYGSNSAAAHQALVRQIRQKQEAIDKIFQSYQAKRES